jgi:hypothetical protein
MKERTFFNWLIIFLGVVAIVGFCFKPAFADEVTDPAGVIDQSEDNSTLETPFDVPELSDESFGLNYQYTWIPACNFIPASSNVAYSRSNAYIFVTGGTDYYFWAGVNLPSGAYLSTISLYYYDNSGGAMSSYFYRATAYTTYSLLTNFTSSGTPGYATGSMSPNTTIRNGDSAYYLYVGLSGAAGSDLRFMGARLYWRRQIRTGLSHPFTDIGGLSQTFQDSIAALAQSGITIGTSPTTYSPNNNVTRAQMAVFLARALGLYWAYPY